jgi:hypothetical protein
VRPSGWACVTDDVTCSRPIVPTAAECIHSMVTCTFSSQHHRQIHRVTSTYGLPTMYVVAQTLQRRRPDRTHEFACLCKELIWAVLPES